MLGWLITDNVIIAFEAFRWPQKGRRSGDSYMAIKLDMRKAYDMVEWGFF